MSFAPPAALWSDQLAEELAEIANDVAPLSWWREEIERGAWKVLDCMAGGARVGVIVYRIDAKPACHELVIVGAVGSDPSGEQLLPRALPLLEKMAAAMGCATVRAHTTRLGLVAAMREQGYSAAEWVLRKALA